MFRNLLILFLLNVLAASVSHAQNQDFLTLNEAIQIGLQNNYSILIAENLSEVDKNNAALGNAGFLPTVSANASKSQSIEDSKTTFSGNSIPDQEVDGAKSTNTVAGVELEWTVFDGLRMFTTYEKLKQLKSLGKQQAQLTIEQTVAQITSAFYNIVQLKKSYSVLENTVEISRERIRIAETQKDLGSGSEYDLIQARADLNADSAALIRQEVALNDAKILLNEILARDVQQSIEVSSDIPLRKQMTYVNLEQQTLKNNLNISVARINQEVSELEVKEVKSERYPEISLNVGYNYNKNELGSGILEFSRSNGITYGVTASIDLFDGFNINRRVENAEIALSNSKLALDEQKKQVEAGLNSAYQNYANALKLVDLESKNLKYAEQSVEIALERFRLGTINSIELREAQRTLISAENRLIQAQYEAKIAETELLRLSGQLIRTLDQTINN